MAVDGLHQANIQGDHVELKMNDVTAIEKRNDDVFILNTGSPHYVKFEQDDIQSLDVIKAAKEIRYGHEFKEKGINVNFINQLSPHSISLRTYERGVEDETYSCGTGVTASAITLALKNNYPAGSHTIDVTVIGGYLKVSYHFDNQKETFKDVWLKGPAKFVFSGSVPF
jgi:diaminopimelate epimerase